MKIIIDIPDEDYKFIKDLQFYNSGRRNGKTIERNVINGIKNGKPYDERPQGEWKKDEWGNILCSNCGRDTRNPRYPFFCCFCGADMRGAEK